MTGIGSRASAVRLFAPRQPESPSSSTSVCGGLLVGPVHPAPSSLAGCQTRLGDAEVWSCTGWRAEFMKRAAVITKPCGSGLSPSLLRAGSL